MQKKAATSPRIPKLRRHKASNRAYVELSGKRKYLGVFGSPEAVQAYAAEIAQWLAAGRNVPVDANEITVGEALARYLEWATVRYGGSTQLQLVEKALCDCNRLYSRISAKDFGPLRLMALRGEWVKRDLSVCTTNKYTGILKRAFKWLASREIVPAGVWHGLQTVSGLRRGGGEGRDTAPIEPVSVEHVEAVKPYVSRQVAAMIDLQVLTAARPGELVNLTPDDIDTTGATWECRLTEHKTAHVGKVRTLFFGPKAQGILRPFMLRPADAPLFSPIEAEADRHAKCEVHRHQPNAPAKTDRELGDRYTVKAYHRAIQRACKTAGVPAWHPHQLRHTAATELRRQYGLDAAQVVLGHSGARITEVYAAVDSAKARAIMAQIG